MQHLAIIRKSLQLRYTVALIKISQLSDALLSSTSNISMIASCMFLPAVMKTKDFRKR
jgi:hypothetical protein